MFSNGTAPAFAEEGRPAPPPGSADLDDVAPDMPADQFGRLPLDQQASPVHDDQPVAEAGGLVHVVGRQQDGKPVRPELLQTLPDLVARLGVEAGRRLVEDQELRLVEERPGHDETPHHPAREVDRREFSLWSRPMKPSSSRERRVASAAGMLK